eukprot:SAG11_NODE_2089_length_3844_cov_3.009880_6_plen_72_part_00
MEKEREKWGEHGVWGAQVEGFVHSLEQASRPLQTELRSDVDMAAPGQRHVRAPWELPEWNKGKGAPEYIGR